MKAILEKITPERDRSFHVFEWNRGPRFKCPFHYHPEIELVLIVAGEGQRYVGDHIARFKAGDLVLMGANLPHMYISDANSRRAHSSVLQFLPGCLGDGFFERGELKAVRALLARARVGLSIHGKTRTRAAVLLQELQLAAGPARLVLFLRLLDLLAGSRETRTLASPSYAPSLALYQGERINLVCGLISHRFRENVTQNEAARLARMSVPSFSRFFRRATNKTFRGFLNEVRIGHAAQRLVESDLTVAEVCYESGFANLSNFNRQFLRLRRVSPRDYRRKLAPN